MEKNKNYLLYGMLVLGAIFGAWYFFGKRKASGDAPASSEPTEAAILRQIGIIKASPDWYNGVKQKAAENKKSIEEQLRLDAIYSIKNF